ncbi:MAG: Ig-like domain-containing protein [Pseudonocardiaceae bacterium]
MSPEAPATAHSLSTRTGSFTYQPSLLFIGTDTFTYQAQDPSGVRSATTTVRIRVELLSITRDDGDHTQPQSEAPGCVVGIDPRRRGARPPMTSANHHSPSGSTRTPRQSRLHPDTPEATKRPPA